MTWRKKPKSCPNIVPKSKDSEHNTRSHFRDLEIKDNDAVIEVQEQNPKKNIAEDNLRVHGKSGNSTIKSVKGVI